MLFGREYMPEGAGVSPDTPRKKGAARLWEILSRDLDGIFLSGALAADGSCHPALCLYFSADRIVGAQPAGDAGSVCPH